MEIFEKKKVFLAKINGIPYYIKVKRDISGNILQIFEKPDLSQINWHVSGEHKIVDNPVENHYDNFSGGITWKQYPLKDGERFNSKYWVSGPCFGVLDSWTNPASFAIMAN